MIPEETLTLQPQKKIENIMMTRKTTFAMLWKKEKRCEMD